MPLLTGLARLSAPTVLLARLFAGACRRCLGGLCGVRATQVWSLVQSVISDAELGAQSRVDRQFCFLSRATLILLVAVAAFQGPGAQAAGVLAKSAIVTTQAGETTFNVRLSKGVTVEVFTLAKPYRVVIDLPGVAFRFAKGTGQHGAGLVKAFRYGLFAANKGRIVVDTNSPVRIADARMRNVPGGGVDLILRLAATDASSFGAGTGPPRSQATAKQAAATSPDVVLPRKSPRRAGQLPVVVIDPGHGGVDPGAVAAKGVYEKDIVLSVARTLVRRLRKTGRFNIKTTRDSDVFVSLDDRLEMSRNSDADLFVSLHADSLGDMSFAQRVRGATVYTLSERASDEHARRMAEKENSSDLIAGLAPATEPLKQDVTDILIDLMKRETADFSADFSRLLVSKLKAAVPISRDPKRSAAFKVLKQTRTPAVLIELGYLSNVKDRKMMQTQAWQAKATQAIAKAVSAYFDKRTARAD